MPSGRGGSGGHFGGGSFRSHSGGHFGGSRSRSVGPSFHWRGWHHPHVMFFFGRPVYMSSGRAGTVSVVGLLIVFAVIASIFCGIGWSSYEDDLDAIRTDYNYYHQMALNAADDESYQLTATVDRIEQYNASGKYCIYYHFYTTHTSYKVDGFSFYVYDYNTARKLKDNGVVLALDTTNDAVVSTTDSVPLDYMNTTLNDDAEYLDYLATRNGVRQATYIALGITGVLILLAVMVPLTAKKATAEQIAENKKADSSTATTDSQDTKDVGVWRCRYCNTLNDGSKHACEGCGAQRQN